MTASINKLLFDIETSIKSINIHLGKERNFHNFQSNLTIKRAVERELEIIGEAVSKILKIKPDFKLTNARKIVDLRNVIIHSYDAIDDETIWGIVSNHIPKLEKEVSELLK